MNRWRRSEDTFHSAFVPRSIDSLNIRDKQSRVLECETFFIFFYVQTPKPAAMLMVSSVLINSRRDRRVTGSSFYVALQLRFIVPLRCRWQAAN